MYVNGDRLFTKKQQLALQRTPLPPLLTGAIRCFWVSFQCQSVRIPCTQQWLHPVRQHSPCWLGRVPLQRQQDSHCQLGEGAGETEKRGDSLIHTLITYCPDRLAVTPAGIPALTELSPFSSLAWAPADGGGDCMGKWSPFEMGSRRHVCQLS